MKRREKINSGIFKKIISIILSSIIILGVVPSDELFSYADEGFVINEIIVTKTFRDIYGAEGYLILITGRNFLKENKSQVIVEIPGSDGELQIVFPNIPPTNYSIQYKLQPSEISGSIYINGESVNISDDGMPSITNKEPTTGIVDGAGDGEVTLIGSGFSKLDLDTSDPDIKAYFLQGITEKIINKGTEDTKISSKALKGETGTWSILFRRNGTISVNEQSSVSFKIEHRYVDIFTILNKLDVSDEIELIPTQGAAGSQVSLKADSLKKEKEMSVFFLKSLNDDYTVANLAIDENHRRDEKEKKDIFSIGVPSKLDVGTYFVVLTNNIDNPTKNIKEQIESYKVLDKKFTVIDSKHGISQVSIDPNTGSSKGIDAVVKGINIGRISSAIYEKGIISDIDITTDSRKMVIEYTGGKYKLIGENGVNVETLEREVQILIGGYATFRENSDFDKDTFDYINIKVGENTDSEKLTKDVIIQVTTTIEYKDDKDDNKTAEIVEEYVLVDGFTYEPLDYVPKITDIIPDKIPVNDDNNILPGLKISIIGENFLLYRYEDDNGNVKYRYPKINLGGRTLLDKNEDDSIEIKMLDKGGNEIYGTTGNDLATKILITIPDDTKIDENLLGDKVSLKVTNPIRVPGSDDEGSSATGEIIFIKPTDDKIPKIIDVVPSIVTSAGEKGVIIEGINFEQNVSVYIDGIKVSNVKVDGIGEKITFDAPPNKEGYYQIMVQNETSDSKGMAIFDDFLYVSTYTEPRITNFNPQKGTAGTLVTLTGENLLPPNPLVKDLDGIGILKLVGTRVFLGGKDINNYHTKDGKVELQVYETSGDNLIIKSEGNQLKLSDYYHSVVLEEEAGVYYKIYFDTKSGKILLTDGDRNTYELIAKDGKVYGKKSGQDEQELTISDDKNIKIDSKELKMKTPYEIKNTDEGKEIVGNRVKVLNNNELIFEIPPKEREGYYDITIINPDTKKDSKTGNDGFYYSFQPEFNPEIDEIIPNEGSTDGEYYINIIGNKFIDNGGDNKTSVTIGSVVVDSKDIEIAPDGKGIKVKVPKYPGDLEKETDMDRKTVPVVVVNPDGGSASIEEGFTYVIPISHPKIDNLILPKGSAAGGESITIEGSGFRFFEPYEDLNNNAVWDPSDDPEASDTEGEPFTDLNKNGKWDDLRYWLGSELKEKYEELAGAGNKDYEQNILPILPKVYFGGEQVAIKNFTAGTIEVETPRGTAGPKEVYVVNNDYGTSNKVVFTYETLNPKINSILPATGKKQGNQKVEIMGENFKDSKVDIIKSKDGIEEQELQLVQFGNPEDSNISNRDIPIDALQNSGKMRDNQTTVKVGNLTVKYDATQGNRILDFTIEEGTGDNKATYTFKYDKYDDTEVFLSVNLLKDEAGNSYNGTELVKIGLERITGAVSTSRLRIDRGFSPNATLENPAHIILNTPSYYSVGTVPVTVTNPDGGGATADFEYGNPDSNPKIINITRDGQQPQSGNNGTIKILTVNIKGDSTIVIEGSDFRDVGLIEIGNIAKIERKDILANESNRLVFKMPEVNESVLMSLHTVYVTNEDKGTASSDDASPPIYIQFIKGESNPHIDELDPPGGPTTGGNTVKITGKDFRQIMGGHEGGKFKVYFDDKQVPESDVRFINYKTVEVKAPPGTLGAIKVKVENPDGEISNSMEYTYTSSPQITSVVDPLDSTEKAVISTISIEGGQEIKLKGTGFVEGAEVYFAPKVIPVTDSEGGAGKIIYIEGKPYILEVEQGSQGEIVDFKGEGTIIVKTPALKTGSKGIIIVNPDGGASPVYQNLTYGIPEIAAPSWIEAELVYDRFIRVHWGAVSGTAQYEIFVVIDDRTTELIGSTELTSFAYSDLEPGTRYKFIVKAVGEYGSSKASLESNVITTDSIAGPLDEDGGLAEHTEMTKTGGIAKIAIGTKDRGTTDLVVDLTKGTLAGSTEVVVSIPAGVIMKNGSRNVQVIGKDFSLNFKLSVFDVATIRENSSGSDVGVRFKIAPNEGNTQVALGNQLSTVYNLDATIYVGNASTSMDYLAGPVNLTLDYDVQKANLRRLSYVNFNHFNPETNSWQSVGLPAGTAVGSVSGTVNRLGRYTVVGSRR